MTTLREAAQKALDALEDACGNRCNREYNPCLQREAAEAIRAALAAPPEELELPKVRLWQFLRMIEGKEDFRGIPIMRTEWPTQGEALAQPEQEHEAIASLVEQMGIEGYGTLAIAAAIRARGRDYQTGND